MIRTGFLTLTLGITMLFATSVVAQEDLPNLSNLGFETTWTSGNQVPGWDYLPFDFTSGAGASGPTGTPNQDNAPSPETGKALKFEIGEIGERTGLLFKEVNWGPNVNSITATIDVRMGRWGGFGDTPPIGEVGIGIDPDGGATTWSDVTATATAVSSASGDNVWIYNISTGPVAKPGGATTFTLVLYAHRFPNRNYWNAHVDNVEIDTDFSFTIPPESPVVNSPSHAPGVWSNNTDLAVSFPTNLADMYSYELDSNAATTPDQVSEGTPTVASFPGQSDNDVTGDQYFHVIAGNTFGWSAATHFGPILIDTATPTITSASWSLASGGGISVSADTTDTGGSPFDKTNIRLLGPELLGNGGAETGDWSIWDATGNPIGAVDQLAFSPGAPYAGNHYFSSTITGTIDATMTQVINVQPGLEYRLSTWAYIGSQDPDTTTLQLQWINGTSGAPQTVASLSKLDDQSPDWEFVEGTLFPSASTITVMVRMIGPGSGVKGVHLDEISLLRYMGNPNTYSGGTAAWMQEPGTNGEVLTVVAFDEAGNRTTLDLTPLTGVSPISASGLSRQYWHMFR